MKQTVEILEEEEEEEVLQTAAGTPRDIYQEIEDGQRHSQWNWVPFLDWTSN